MDIVREPRTFVLLRSDEPLEEVAALGIHCFEVADRIAQPLRSFGHGDTQACASPCHTILAP